MSKEKGDKKQIKNAKKPSVEQFDIQIKRLKEELNSTVKEKNEYLDSLKRMKADLLNEKMILDKRYKEGKDRFIVDYIYKLIPILDSFDLAFQNENDDKNWREGIVQVRAQFIKILSEDGVSIFDPIGENFDHNLHESVGVVPVDKKEKDGKVMSVLQKGYMLKDKVIRPAIVITSEYKQK